VQASFSDLEYDANKRLTRRDRFLAEIESVTPWTLLVAEQQQTRLSGLQSVRAEPEDQPVQKVGAR
jgi:hypothetical protein